MRMRVTTAMWSARLRRRSPPRLMRCRTVLPEDAGIGFTPARLANAASDRMRPRCDHVVSATATVTGPMPGCSSRVRAALDNDLKEITKRITDLVHQSPARTLLEQPGIGPVTAAVDAVSDGVAGRRRNWVHAGEAGERRFGSDAAQVRPRGQRHRGGDRRLNRALHMAVVTRMRMDPATRAYVERRTAEGRTLREIRRCLKRYLARQIYRHLNSAAATEERQPATT